MGQQWLLQTRSQLRSLRHAYIRFFMNGLESWKSSTETLSKKTSVLAKTRLRFSGRGRLLGAMDTQEFVYGPVRLHQVVQEYWPEFQAELASQGKYLPAFVTREFDAYLKCGRLEHGFLRVRCESCHDEKSVAGSLDSVPVVGQGAWLTAPLCWWMTLSLISRCVS